MPPGDGPRPLVLPRGPARSSLLQIGSPKLPPVLARRVLRGRRCPASTHGRGAPVGRAIRTAGAIGGSSCHPLDRSDELPAAVPKGIGGRDSIFLLKGPHDGFYLVSRHVLMVVSDADLLPPAQVALPEHDTL